MRPDAMPSMPLRCTSDFEVEERLGSGSYGEVRLFKDKQNVELISALLEHLTSLHFLFNR